MRSTLTRAALRGAGAAALLIATAAPVITPRAVAAGPGSDSATRSARSVIVHRGGPDATIRFHRAAAGEVFLKVTVSARGVSWAARGNESAVVSASVDGHYATDIVITSAGPVARRFALGHLRAGGHTLQLHYATGRSPSKAGVAKLQDIGFTTVRPSDPGYAAARYAPVLFGRDVAGLGGRFQNNRTDTPLIAWHQVLPAATRGHSMIEYSVTWSNEDGGTNSPLLMAQWGRTTDIEWVYRVEVDADGRRVPGSGVFQSAGHGTSRFHGRYDGTHPLLETCTSNNNVCDTKVDDPMRFALSTRRVLPADQPREHEMDVQPWTYQVMAAEMLREHKIESPSDPSTPGVGDQRTYLYLAVAHDTAPPTSAAGVGVVVDVRLKNDPTTYSSDHDNSLGLGSINRDGPAATTVELPVGTTRADIESISVHRVPFGAAPDNGASVTVTDLDRAFFLGPRYLPRPSFAQWHGSVLLTTAAPTQQIWPALPG